MTTNKQRVHFLDELRGLAIIGMVVYHAAYDCVILFDLDFPFFFSSGMNLLRDWTAGIFILLSGIVSRYSRSNLKRGLICLGLAMGMTLATALFMPDQVIVFGVLHMLGCCMLFISLIERAASRILPAAGLVVFLLFFWLTVLIPFGTVGFPPFLRFQVPDVFYTSPFLFAVGLPSASFYSSDYYPLVPWLFLFLAGYFLGFYFKEGRMPAFFYRQHCRWLSVVGSHTLVIYILHQPLLYGVFTLLTLSTR